MKMNTLFQSGAFLPHNLDSARDHSTAPLPFIAKFRQAFTDWFMSLTQTADPQVTLKRDRSGEHYWQVYDPSNDRLLTFFTAKEVRIWLEQRYYH